jgi:hypothetical protein
MALTLLCNRINGVFTPSVTTIGNMLVSVNYPRLDPDSLYLPYSCYTKGNKITWQFVNDVATGTFQLNGRDVVITDPNMFVRYLPFLSEFPSEI